MSLYYLPGGQKIKWGVLTQSSQNLQHPAALLLSLFFLSHQSSSYQLLTDLSVSTRAYSGPPLLTSAYRTQLRRRVSSYQGSRTPQHSRQCIILYSDGQQKLRNNPRDPRQNCAARGFSPGKPGSRLEWRLRFLYKVVATAINPSLRRYVAI